MANFFDQFDSAAQPSANFFDQFDAPKTSAWRDALASAGAGLVKGGAAILTTPQMLHDTAGNIVDWALDKTIGIPKDRPKALLEELPSLPRQADVVKSVEDNVTGKLHEPTTKVGKYAETAAEFIPAAVAGPGGVIRNAVRYGVIPGVAAEAASQATEGSPYQPYAKAAGALAGLGAGHVAMRPNSAERVVSEAMGGAVDQGAMTAAGQLMQDAAQRGITLTWPEAIQQVTNSATKLGDVQRVVEGSQAGGAIMRPAMANRAQQVDQAVQQNLDRIAPPGANPFTVGPEASQAATGVVNDVRGAINNYTRPLYDRAQLDRIPAADYQRLAQDSRYQAALNEIRNHPEIGPELNHLPDNAVPVVDQVKKLLQTRAEVTPMADATERYLGSLRGTAGTAAENAATRASPAYAQAIAEQAQLRGQYLNPLQQGPVGKVAGQAGNETTEAVVNALLPNAPLPGSAPQVGQAFRAIGARNPEAASNIVRQKMEGTYNQAARDLQGGPNEWGGAKYAAKLYGNPQARDNLQAAITETAGPAVTADTDALVQALQATGRRQHAGSQTEFNRILTRALEGGGTVGEALTAAASKFNPLAALRDRYQQYRYGANTEALARLLLEGTPAQMGQLSRATRGNPQARLLLAQILANGSAAP